MVDQIIPVTGCLLEFVNCVTVIVADLTQANTSYYWLDLGTPLSETKQIMAVILWLNRISGTGIIDIAPNEDETLAQFISYARYGEPVQVKAGNNRLRYAFTVANDHFAVRVLGYWRVP